MKKIIGYIGAHLLFWLGDLACSPMTKWDSARLFTIYQTLMTWSHSIQNWAGLDTPWEKIEEDNESN